MVSIDSSKSYKGRRSVGGTKYPWRYLEIGEYFDITNVRERKQITAQASAAGKRYKRHFRTQAGFPGNAVRVWRTAGPGHVPQATSRPYDPQAAGKPEVRQAIDQREMVRRARRSEVRRRAATRARVMKERRRELRAQMAANKKLAAARPAQTAEQDAAAQERALSWGLLV